jgi:hypothetical protein
VVNKFITSFVYTFLVLAIFLIIVIFIDLVIIRKTVYLHTQMTWFVEILPETVTKKDKNLMGFMRNMWHPKNPNSN